MNINISIAIFSVIIQPTRGLFAMSAFYELRSKAGLTINEASRLLGVEPARIEAYDGVTLIPAPRELQVLKGVAMVARGKATDMSCESSSTRDIPALREIARRNRRASPRVGKSLTNSQKHSISSDMVAKGVDQASFPLILQDMRQRSGMSAAEISQLLGASLVSVVRWERGDNRPGPDMAAKILALHEDLKAGKRPILGLANKSHTFASRGARTDLQKLPLFRHRLQVSLLDVEQKPLIERLKTSSLWGAGESVLASLLDECRAPSRTIDEPAISGVSAGKNTYTYDAHTYHTKVPPQGISRNSGATGRRRHCRCATGA